MSRNDFDFERDLVNRKYEKHASRRYLTAERLKINDVPFEAVLDVVTELQLQIKDLQRELIKRSDNELQIRMKGK